MAGYYGGYLGNEAGMDGMLAGSPCYFMPENIIQDRLFRYGMDNTESGRQIQERIQQLRQRMPQAANFQLQEGLPGAAGNLGALAQVMPNAGNLGGMVGSPAEMAPVMGPPQFSLRPRVEMNDDQLKVGGRAMIPLGSAEALGLQGEYVPDTNAVNIRGSLGKPPGSPGFGIDFGYTKSPRFGSGFYGGVNGRF